MTVLKRGFEPQLYSTTVRRAMTMQVGALAQMWEIMQNEQIELHKLWQSGVAERLDSERKQSNQFREGEDQMQRLLQQQQTDLKEMQAMRCRLLETMKRIEHHLEGVPSEGKELLKGEGELRRQQKELQNRRAQQLKHLNTGQRRSPGDDSKGNCRKDGSNGKHI